MKGVSEVPEPRQIRLCDITRKRVKMSTLDSVRRSVADVTRVPLEDVTPESSPDTIETWDSLQHLNLVLSLEESFDIRFSPEEIKQMANVKMIALLIEEKQST